MKLRIVDCSGDMCFGNSLNNFQTNTRGMVAQLISSRLRLWVGEFFADTSDGMPWSHDVLGNRTTSTYDAAIKDRILSTEGVVSIKSYSSSLANRKLSVNVSVLTEYTETGDYCENPNNRVAVLGSFIIGFDRLGWG